MASSCSTNRSWSFELLWPIELLVQEFEGADAVDGVWAVEPLDRRAVADAELVIAALHLRVFVADPFVEADAIIVAALDHERPRRDEHGHFRVIGRVREIPFRHLVLPGDHVGATV